MGCPVSTHFRTHKCEILTTKWLDGLTVRTLDLRLRGCGFDSRLGRYQVVTTRMGDCLRTCKPSWYVTNTKVNAFKLSLPSIRAAWLRWRWGCCVGWQV